MIIHVSPVRYIFSRMLMRSSCSRSPAAVSVGQRRASNMQRTSVYSPPSIEDREVRARGRMATRPGSCCFVLRFALSLCRLRTRAWVWSSAFLLPLRCILDVCQAQGHAMRRSPIVHQFQAPRNGSRHGPCCAVAFLLRWSLLGGGCLVLNVALGGNQEVLLEMRGSHFRLRAVWLLLLSHQHMRHEEPKAMGNRWDCVTNPSILQHQQQLLWQISPSNGQAVTAWVFSTPMK